MKFQEYTSVFIWTLSTWKILNIFRTGIMFSTDDIPSSAFPWMKVVGYWFKFRWSLFLNPIGIMPALVQVMIWCLKGDRPSLEPAGKNTLPLLTCQFRSAYESRQLCTHCLIRKQWIFSTYTTTCITGLYAKYIAKEMSLDNRCDKKISECMKELLKILQE